MHGSKLALDSFLARHLSKQLSFSADTVRVTRCSQNLKSILICFADAIEVDNNRLKGQIKEHIA